MRKSSQAAAALLLGWAGSCFAHAHLQSSIPAASAQVPHAPSTLTLNFSEQAQLAVLKLVGSGNTIAVPLDRTATPSTNITVVLPPLKAGKYDVQWSAISHYDGHVSKGSFSFTILGP